MKLSCRLSFTGLILLLFSGTFCLQAPAAAHSRQYDMGSVYEYNYETSVLLNEPQPNPVSTAKDVGFRLRVKAEVTPVWQHSSGTELLLQITVVSPKLSVKARQGPTPDGFVDKQSKVDTLRNTPLFVHWVAGNIRKVFSVKDEDISSVNLKKGIASLLQVQLTQTELQEVDASGRCAVRYVTGDRGKVVKYKTNCVPNSNSQYFNHTNKVLGASVSSTASVSYELRPEDNVVMRASGLETHFLRVEARKTSASEVISRQTLVMTGERQAKVAPPVGATEADVIRDLARKTRQELVAGELSTEEDVRECIACKTLQELVTNFKSTLSSSNLGTQSSALAFIRLLRKMRESPEKTIKAVLSAKKNSKIVPQLLDIVASTQTPASHRAAMTYLNFQEDKKILLPERYLLTIALATHPSEVAIRDLFGMVKRGLNNNHLYETLVYTVASLVKTYSRMSDNEHKPLVVEVNNYLEQQLQRCSTTACELIYVAALKSLQQKGSIPLLLNLVKTSHKKAAINAMRAVQTMPSEFVDDQIIKSLERIFFGLDRRHDSSVKVIAADMLLQHNPSEEFLRRLLADLTDQSNKEVNTVLLSKVYDHLDKGNEKLSQVFHKIIRGHDLGNYHVLAQNGLSSAFSRPLSVGSASTANSSFTNVLEISGGLMKRSTVDVFVDNNDTSLRLLSFGIFAGGLDMFGGAGEEDDNGGEPEDANAGIEITLMDTQLRPYVFFTSKSELMSHVWSGTASDRTTALQGSALLQDHQQRVPLQNGFSVDMLLTGAISYDFAGQVQISLWSQNAHSLVEIGAGMVIQGQARVDTSFVQTMIEFNTGVQTRLDFVSDLQFSNGVMMCMQMSQPKYEIIENVRKLERIPGSNYVLRKYKRREIQGPGKTYVINKKNTLLCNKMFNDRDY